MLCRPLFIPLAAAAAIDLPPSVVMSSAPPRRVGFDVIAKLITNISLDVTPVSPTLVGAVTAAGRNVKSSFTLTTGKKRKAVDDSSLSSTTPSTKRRATVTPASLPSPDAFDCSYATNASLGGAMLIDRDIVPPHVIPHASVVQPFYRRLLPGDTVCLMAGSEIIVVLPACGARQWIRHNNQPTKNKQE